ncbi:sugar phosphate isomerase/epimerase family protein [Clostridium tagluense]|uniref:sugar phosphate isomerase/epimerase family protein n=1 Tax=Clostridium tagluense TaxID=360422 RepID=UPI001C6DFBF4|nr:TIM barrel protein [Clostridium tagluense]MBW9157958.1 sugar phosphate isomerase/epimerase [Clostridium tagluense]WLC66205.1 sugar phosphate isomerase/epimerase [Clostridium tagluense]
MNFKLQQCVGHIDEFDAIENYNLSIGVEIQDFATSQLLDEGWELRVEKYKEKISGFKGTISLHGAYVDLNPGSPDKKIVEVTKERYLQTVKIAKAVKASYIIFHSQINVSIKDPKVKEIKINRQLYFWKEILEEIEQTDMVILLENFAESDFNDLLMLVEKINSPKVKVCLDLGHVLANSLLGIRQWIEGLNSYIEYIHFHWNDGSYDAHQAPIEGFIEEVSSTLKENKLEPILALEYGIENIEEETNRVRKYL